MEYAKLANSINEGNFVLNDNLYAFRWTILYPLTLFYKCFNVNNFSNTLFTWFPILGTIIFTLKFLDNHSFLQKALATCFLLFSPIHLLYLEKPMPDLWVEFRFFMFFYAFAKLDSTTSILKKYNHFYYRNCCFVFS